MTKYCDIEFKNDRRKEIVNQKNNAIERALTAVGMQGEGYAKIKCPVKTGLLRNRLQRVGKVIPTKQIADGLSHR